MAIIQFIIFLCLRIMALLLFNAYFTFSSETFL